MADNKNTLTPRQRNQFTSLSHEFSDEEMVRDWTLTEADKLELNKYRKNFRTFIAIQICAIRLYGRFLNEVNSISIRIINYLNNQLELPPSLTVISPERDATFSEQRKNILEYLGFTKYDEQTQNHLKAWLEKLALQGNLPNELFQKAEHYLLTANVVLPGQSVLERLIISICTAVHEKLFEAFFKNLTEALKSNIDTLLVVKAGEQHSPFQLLKEYPPSASISSIQSYLHRYQLLAVVDIDSIKIQLEPSFVDYLYN